MSTPDTTNELAAIVRMLRHTAEYEADKRLHEVTIALDNNLLWQAADALEASAERERRYREALVNVRAHTGLPPHPSHELLMGLVGSIARIVDAALSTTALAPDPPEQET